MGDDSVEAGDPVPPPPAPPPDDPDDWTDEQWLDWLRAGDAVDDDRPSAPRPQRGRAAGSLLGSAMLGLADAIYGPQRPKVVIEAEVPGGSHDDDLDVHLDPDHPELSVVVVRRRRPTGGGAGATGSKPGVGGPPAAPEG